MLINDEGYMVSSVELDNKWAKENNYYIIDETTEQGQLMAKTYIANYPFVDFTHDGKFVTSVIVLEEQKQLEHEKKEQERLEQGLLDSLIPSDEEMLMAEVEIQTITILMEVGLI